MELIEIIKERNTSYQKKVENLLYQFDNQYGTTPYYQNRTTPTDTSLFGFYLKKENEIIGGVVVYQAWDWLFIDLLAIREEYRKKGYGKQLFQYLEAYANNEKLVAMKVSTLDFQARGFYEKQGFHVICELRDCPRGNTKYELVKYLERAEV